MKDSKIGAIYKIVVILIASFIVGSGFNIIAGSWFFFGSIGVYIAEQFTNPF